MENKKSQKAPAQKKALTEPKPPKLSPTAGKVSPPATKAPGKKAVPNVTLPKSPTSSPSKAPMLPKAKAQASDAKSVTTAPKLTPKEPIRTPAPVIKVPQAQAPKSSKPMQKTAKEPKGLLIQPWHLVVSLIVVVALVVGGMLLGHYLGNQSTNDPIVNYTGPLVNNNPADPNGITLPGYPTITLLAGRQKVALELPNPNGNPCYFRYTLTIVETGEEIYQSQLLAPGEAVQELTLNQPLRAGAYTLRITIETFSLSDGTTPMNGGVQEVKLIVE